jgi:hypothetical protein
MLGQQASILNVTCVTKSEPRLFKAETCRTNAWKVA